MRAYIVEEESATAEKINLVIEEWSKKNTGQLDEIINIDFCDLNDIKIEDTDIFFLNMRTSIHESGIVLARDIRRRNLKAYIIFIIEYKEQLINAFDYLIRPSGVIVKPINSEQIKKIEVIMTSIKNDIERAVIRVKIGHDDICIPINEILYIQYENRKCILKTHIQSYTVRETYTSLIKRLGKDFITIDKGTGVNINKIKSWNSEKRMLRIGCMDMYYARDRSKNIRIAMMENGILHE